MEERGEADELEPAADEPDDGTVREEGDTEAPQPGSTAPRPGPIRAPPACDDSGAGLRERQRQWAQLRARIEAGRASRRDPAASADGAGTEPSAPA